MSQIANFAHLQKWSGVDVKEDKLKTYKQLSIEVPAQNKIPSWSKDTIEMQNKLLSTVLVLANPII